MANIDQKPKDKNGKEHGEWIVYYSHGKLAYRANYFNGVAHGFFEVFNHDGTLSYKGNFNMSRKIGYWYLYNIKRYYLWLI